MFIIIICLALIVFMPLIAKVPVAIEMAKLGKYDNKHPRNQQALLTGFGARAMSAHKNCYEAIAYFAPSVLLVLALDEHTLFTAQLCVVFVVMRCLFVVFYWCNLDVLRSIAWLVGMATIVAHYWMLLS